MIRVSSPGKILWIGSYSVVFGGISHVIAVNKRVSCRLREIQERSLIFHTSYGDFKNSGNELINSVLDTFRERFTQLPQGYEIELYNDKEFILDGKKTGLGSSSAATVSLTACLYYAINGNLDLFEIHKLAQIANFKRQKGIGSGFDIASAVFGSIIYKRFTDLEKMDFYYEKLKLGNYDMVLGFTGKSSETVGLVKKFVEKSNLEDFREIMRLIDEENNMAIKLVKLNKIDEAVEHVRLGRKYLNYIAERIVGVKLVSKEEEELIKIAEEEGALIALSPGAGGGDSIFALGNDLSKVREAWKRRGITTIDVKENEGLKLDSN
ncbi:GHMP kinase [Sulfolobus islandicus]|uniref:phosphomevalonate kinase n=1 Tax=Saccharolobus islandicus (strain HVE10/4) TaxID=930943 RepID=F0NLF4_SACI0|nr:phosphomevalonate kinase [Sulfolobus islandicus]ADX83645.1 GHMP kinase [Sulfolobus islandicus HVE10/4]WCM37626.1 GHMP kinase [Sulfolobus islandicus]